LIRKEREEGQQQGAVSLKAYRAYFTSGSGMFGVIFVVFLFLAGQLALVGTDYWLSTWYLNHLESQKNSSYLIFNFFAFFKGEQRGKIHVKV